MKYAEVLETLAGRDRLPGRRPEGPGLVSLRRRCRRRRAKCRGADVDGLFEAARRVRPGGTILLADGVYPMTRRS